MFACLSVSAIAAKTLSAALDIPLIGVHHMVSLSACLCPDRSSDTFSSGLQQAHALTPFLTEREPPAFPFLTLLVSGGHTLLLLARSESNFQILATTEDESIGCAALHVAYMCDARLILQRDWLRLVDVSTKPLAISSSIGLWGVARPVQL